MSTLIDRHLKIPKYLQLAEDLRQQIADGALQPGDQLPSFSEMKLQFEAAQHTVEKAHGLLEADGLIRREPGRGIFVNHSAPRKITGNVGFVAPYNMQPEHNIAYWGTVLAGMRSAALDHNYSLLLIDNGSDFTRWDKIDGAVICDTHDPRDHQPGLPQLPNDVPFVSLFNEISGTTCVTPDDFNGTYQLTKHLTELGHKRIAYLATMNAGLSSLNHRKEGYLKALQEANIEPDLRCMRELRRSDKWEGLPTWYPLAGEDSMRAWLAENWAELECTALIAQNDDTARGAIAALQSTGLNVPRDVSVVGFDGLPAHVGTMQLTTIQAPLYEIGRQAMMALLDWLNDPAQTPRNICLPISFVHGQSTAPPKCAAIEPELVAG